MTMMMVILTLLTGVHTDMPCLTANQMGDATARYKHPDCQQRTAARLITPLWPVAISKITLS